MLLTGKKKECRLLSVMPADSIAAAAQKGGLRQSCRQLADKLNVRPYNIQR
jgi:hypothetical protein